MASAVTENKVTNVETNLPAEIVQFTTAASGDYYDCKYIKEVTGAYVGQSTTDGLNIKVSWALQSNGIPRVTLTLASGTAITGFLTIFGRL